jgi:hypothetical protein
VSSQTKKTQVQSTRRNGRAKSPVSLVMTLVPKSRKAKVNKNFPFPTTFVDCSRSS